MHRAILQQDTSGRSPAGDAQGAGDSLLCPFMRRQCMVTGMMPSVPALQMQQRRR